jgi:pimeloyl-[acyl-carrier protein] methyl ester esterase
LAANLDCVLLHGWGMSSSIWNDFSLAAKSFNSVVAPCLYKHTSKAGSNSFDLVAKSLSSLIKKDAVIVAWSMSGLIAAPLAMMNKNIRAIVFISSSPCFVNKVNWRNVIDENAINNLQNKLSKNPESLLEYFSGLVAYGDVSEKKTNRFIRSHVTNSENNEVLFDWLEQMKQIDQRELFAKIEVPLLFILGKNDSLINSDIKHQLKQLLPETEIKTINDCGHAPFISKQNVTMETIEKFINAKLH